MVEGEGLVGRGIVEQADPHPGDLADDATVKALQEQFGFSEEQARKRFRAENEASRLSVILESENKTNHAGIWLELDGSAQIHVAFTGNWRTATDALRERSEMPEAIVGREAAASLAELRAAQRSMVRDRTDLQNGRWPSGLPEELRATGGKYDVDIDVRLNQLVLLAKDVDQASLTPKLRQRYHPSAQTQRKNPAAPAACASREDCRFEMRGGISLNGGATCSSGFVAQSFDGVRRFVLSAAHCGGNNVNDVGVARSNGGSYYGTVHGNFQSGSDDVERIINDTADLVNWVNHNPIFLNPGDYRNITGYTSYNGIVVGSTTYGKTGRATGNTQGFVQSKTFAPGYVPSSHSFIRTNMCIAPGDSGGAVYRQNNAVGLVSGYSGHVCSDPNYFGIFSSIQYAITRANVNLSG